jgi:hypothetical protein
VNLSGLKEYRRRGERDFDAGLGQGGHPSNCGAREA